MPYLVALRAFCTSDAYQLATYRL